MTVQTVYFSIDFEWLTQHIRALWAEGRYGLARDMLESSGCPSDHWFAVLRGKVKMVGINEGHLDTDDWQPDEGSVYPDPDQIFHMAETGEKYRRRYFSQLGAAYADLCIRWQETTNGMELDSLAVQVRAFPADFIESLPPEERIPYDMAMRHRPMPWNDLRGARLESRTMALQTATALPDVDDFIAHQIELDTRPAPHEDVSFMAPSGWLTETGALYPCAWFEHDWLASVLGYTVAEVEDKGWVRLGTRLTGEVVIRRASDNPLPQPQLDALWLWCSKHGQPLPDWAKV